MGWEEFMRRGKNFVLIGEAGCGKSELALNLACRLAAGVNAVRLFDLDMTKPLFRTRDLAQTLAEAGVCLHYEQQFMDAPTTVGGVRQSLLDPACRTVLDVGGDHIGARSIGGYAPLINRPDTLVCYLINPYRAWSLDLMHIDGVLGQILKVSHIPAEKLCIISNATLGPASTAAEAAQGIAWLQQMIGPYKPVEYHCVQQDLCRKMPPELKNRLLPLRLFLAYPWNSPPQE